MIYVLLAMKSFLALLILNLCMSLFAGCRIVSIPDNVDVETFAAMLQNPKFQLVDVRTLEEFKQGHIEHALLIDVKQPDFIERAEKMLDKKRPIAIYCRSGRRSTYAASLLCKKGYRVTNLIGGFIDWKEQMPWSSSIPDSLVAE